jgi:hypothetical protein
VMLIMLEPIFWMTSFMRWGIRPLVFR